MHAAFVLPDSQLSGILRQVLSPRVSEVHGYYFVVHRGKM